MRLKTVTKSYAESQVYEWFIFILGGLCAWVFSIQGVLIGGGAALCWWVWRWRKVVR